MTIEAETGMIQLPARNTKDTPEARKRQTFLKSLHKPCFQTSSPRTERISVVLRHPVCDHLLQQSRETNTSPKVLLTLHFLAWVLSTLALASLLFLNYTHIGQKGTSSERLGSEHAFGWGTRAVGFLRVPRLQQVCGVFARGDTLELSLNILDTEIQLISEGLWKLPVLLYKQAFHVDQTPSQQVQCQQEDERPSFLGAAGGASSQKVLDWEASVERLSVGAGRAGLPQKALGWRVADQHLCTRQPEGFFLSDAGCIGKS